MTPHNNTDRHDPTRKAPNRSAMEYREHFEEETEFQDALALWPVCPDCGTRRITRCPICKVTGNLFPLADAEFWFDVQVGSEDQQCASHQCHGGSSCCGSKKNDTPSPKTPSFADYVPRDIRPDVPNPSKTPSQLYGELQPGLSDGRHSPHYLVDTGTNPPSVISISNDQFTQLTTTSLEQLERRPLRTHKNRNELHLANCYVCSEPFEPEFPPRCEWCGHDFIIGQKAEKNTTNDVIEESEFEETHWNELRGEETPRGATFLVVLLLIILFLGGMGYLWFLFR